ncbi:MAG: hypothetical protein AAGF12_02850 [Myxococcota bacterium]
MAITLVLALAGCGDDGEALLPVQDAMPDATLDATPTPDATVARDSRVPDREIPDADLPDADASMPDSGIDLTGEPPAPVTLDATSGDDFELLPDNDDFTSFSTESRRVQILPLRDRNFPPGTDYRTAGSDTALNGLQQYARARVRQPLQTWLYDVTIETVAEEDGESVYQLVVGGTVVGTFANPVTEITPGVEDMDRVQHTFEDIVIRDTDEVEIRAVAHSNLTLEEGANGRQWSPTYAWARGRWASLRLEDGRP